MIITLNQFKGPENTAINITLKDLKTQNVLCSHKICHKFEAILLKLSK